MAKWTCRVIQDTNGKYHADLRIAGCMTEGLPSGVDYNTLREAIRQKTGIEILKRGQMIFERYNGKSYAMIDATQARDDCRVTIEEILSGWKPDFSIDDEPTLSQDDKYVLNAVDGAACMYGTDEIRVVADYDTGMINVEIIEQGEWMNRVAAIHNCNLYALAKFLDYRGVKHDF